MININADGKGLMKCEMGGNAYEISQEAISIGIEMGMVFAKVAKSSFAQYIQIMMKKYREFNELNKNAHDEFKKKADEALIIENPEDESEECI